jgi:hypothetical protein
MWTVGPPCLAYLVWSLVRHMRKRNRYVGLPAPSENCRRHWGDSYMKTLRTGRF